MAVSFRLAPFVQPGQKTTSTQAVQLARAHNDKKGSGLGDCCDRIVRWWFNNWRQVRNPDADGFAFPPQGEWWEIYGPLEPEADTQWPITGPGEPEGANLACVGMQFPFGVAPSLPDEPGRLNYDEFEGTGLPLWLDSGPPQTAFDFWILGKIQRGAIDPTNGMQKVPALQAAQSFMAITTPPYSQHGKGYGGFFPLPEKLDSDCGTLPENGLGVPSYAYKFTALFPDVDTSRFHGTVGTDPETGFPTVTYAGSCPFGTEDTAIGHVVARANLPFAYFLAVNNGAGYDIDRFDIKEWIEGEYTGAGHLSRYDGGQVWRSVWAFIQDFAGRPDQRTPDTFKIKDIAFDFQEFFTKQYCLSPAVGKYLGDSIVADYPQAIVSQNTGSGTILPLTGGGTTRTFTSGFVYGGAFAKATKLERAVTVQVLNGNTIIASLVLTPNSNGDAEALIWSTAGLVPNPLKFRLAGDLVFSDATGQLVVEACEQYGYKPEFWDAYLVCRMMATNGGGIETAGVDGRGKDEANAANFWPMLKTYGCIVNQRAAGVRDQADWVNDNPVYDSMRRLCLDTARIVNRRQFRSYGVAGGKSVLTFQRYAYGQDNKKVDCFYNIAPSYKGQTQTVEGETYIVRGPGSVTYQGRSFSEGQKFKARDASAITSTGGAEAFIYEGIRPVAFKNGYSNEWFMWINTHCYSPFETSEFYPTSYADYFTYNDRCHMWSGTAGDPEFRLHVTYGYSVSSILNADGTAYTYSRNPEGVQAQFHSPESPTGYRYAFNSNHTFGIEDHLTFCKSCQIYEAPYQIESATSFFVAGEERVQLVLKTRMRAAPSAPATVDPDPFNWSGADISNLRTEVETEGRYDDNALREYSIHKADVSYQCVFATGDRGMGSSLPTDPDAPFGSCYPHFFFNRALPMPFHDGNDTYELTDSRMLTQVLLQAEIEIKAMCEGFVDGKTSTEITCKTGEGSLFDFKYEELCFQGFQGRWIGSMGTIDRPDKPCGFGPSVNTIIRAEIFNRISACENLLNRCRVMLPYLLECKTDAYLDCMPFASQWPSPPFNCILADFSMSMFVGSGPGAGTLTSAGTWGDCGGGGNATISSFIDGGTCPDADHFNLCTSKTIVSYRVTVDPDSLNAIPLSWRDQVSEISGIIGQKLTTTGRAYAESVSAEVDADDCHGHKFWDGTTGYKFGVHFTSELTCQIFTSGSFDPGGPVGGSFVNAHVPASSDCGNSSGVSIDFQIFTAPGFIVTIPLVAQT